MRTCLTTSWRLRSAAKRASFAISVRGRASLKDSQPTSVRTKLIDRGDKGRNPAFCGRTDVLPLPPELQGRAMLVSGHHGFADLAHGHADRIVCDRSGGTPKEDRPLEAVLLPERTVVGSDGSVTTLLDRSLQGGS